jgi:hypothetical protein
VTTFQLFLLAFAIALDPLPLPAYILMLGSKNGVRKGLGFTIGWVLLLAIIAFVTIEITGGAPPKDDTEPSNFLLIVQIVAGVALLFLAWRQRGKIRKPKPKPKWQQNLDKIGFLGAAGIAMLLQPWVTIAAGAAAVSQSDKVWAVVLYVLIASSTYLVMQTFAQLKPEATMARLSGFTQWLEDHHNAAVIVLYVFIGVWLISKAASSLA